MPDISSRFRSYAVQIIKTLFWPLAITIPLAACGQHAQSSRPLPPAPYAYLSLTACRHYPSNIVECQLDYGTQFGRHRLGPVQQVSRDLATNLDGSRYQITACWPVSRVQRELPNFTCRSLTGSQVPMPVRCWSRVEPLFVWRASWAIETRSSIDGSRIVGRAYTIDFVEYFSRRYRPSG